MRRLVATSVAMLLILTALVSSPQAASAQPRVSRTGTVAVRITSPKNVPGEVVLRRLGSKAAPLLAVKAARATAATVKLRIAPGVYSVRSPSVVWKGVAYGGGVSKKRLVVRRGSTLRLSLHVRALPGSRAFRATAISGDSATLTWTAPKHTTVVLRRGSSATAPTSRRAGRAVRVHGHGAHDTHLSAGHAYSYSLFTKVRGHWTGPLTLTARTRPSGRSLHAAYVAQPGTVFVSKRQIASTSLSGSALAIRLTATAPLPVAGSPIVVPATAALPGGYLGVVTGIGADGRTIQMRPAGLANVFQQYTVNAGDASLGTETAAAAKSTTRTHFSRTPSASRMHPLEDAPSSGEASTHLGCSTGVDSDVDFDHSLQFHRIVQMNVNNGRVAYNLGFSVTAKGAVSVKTTGNATCSADIFSGATPIPSDPVPLIVKWDIGAEVDVQGGVNVQNVGAVATGGFGTRGTLSTSGFHQTPYTIQNGAPLTPTITTDGTAEASLKLGGSVAFGIGTGGEAAGALVGLKGELDPISGKAELERSQTGSPVCLALTVGLHWEADLDAQAWFGPRGWWLSFEREVKLPIAGGDFPYFAKRYWPTGCDQQTGGGGGSPAPIVTPPPAPIETPAPPATTDVRTVAAATTSSDLNCTLATHEDTDGEYYGGSACGTFLSVGGTLYGPASIPAGGSLSAYTSPVAWTPVSQSNSGAGTASDPFVTVTTVAAATTGFEVVQTDTWVAGGNTVSTRMQVVNTTGNDAAVRLYHAFDCYTADDDTGTGGIDATSQTVGCVHINTNANAVLSLRLHAVTGGATYTEDGYSQVWSDISSQSDLNDAALTTGDYDNGEAVAWSATVPANASSTFDADTTLAGPM